MFFHFNKVLFAKKKKEKKKKMKLYKNKTT